MNFFKSFNVIVKRIGTIKKVSDTLVLVVKHMEDFVPKFAEIWKDDFKAVENEK